MKIRYAMLATASTLMLAIGGLAASGATAAQAGTPSAPGHGTGTHAHQSGIHPADTTGWIYIEANDSVINASGCGNPANAIEYPISSGCDGGANEVWSVYTEPSGYDEIYATYGGNHMCLNVDGSAVEYTAINVVECNSNPTNSELFRQPGNTPDNGYGEGDYIVPSQNYSLAFNVSGGLGTSHKIILYPQGAGNNESFYPSANG